MRESGTEELHVPEAQAPAVPLRSRDEVPTARRIPIRPLWLEGAGLPYPFLCPPPGCRESRRAQTRVFGQ